MWGHEHGTYAQKLPKLDPPSWLDPPLCVRTFYIFRLLSLYIDLYDFYPWLKVSLHFSRHNDKWQCNSFFCTKKKQKFWDFVVQKDLFCVCTQPWNPFPPPLYVIVRIWLDSSPLPLCVRTMWMTPIGIIKKNTITQLIHLLKPPQLVQSF